MKNILPLITKILLTILLSIFLIGCQQDVDFNKAKSISVTSQKIGQEGPKILLKEKDKMAILETIKEARPFPLDYKAQYELEITFEDKSSKKFPVIYNFITFNGKSQRMETNLEQQIDSILQAY